MVVLSKFSESSFHPSHQKMGVWSRGITQGIEKISD